MSLKNSIFTLKLNRCCPDATATDFVSVPTVSTGH